MRILPVVLLCGVLAGVTVYFLAPGKSPSQRDDEARTGVAPVDVGAAPREVPRMMPTPTTGKLVVRVRTADGTPVPETTTAGYLDQGVPRMRKAAKDGTFPFTDAPVGALVATANAPGYTADRVDVHVIAGVDSAEPIVTLTPVK